MRYPLCLVVFTLVCGCLCGQQSIQDTPVTLPSSTTTLSAPADTSTTSTLLIESNLLEGLLAECREIKDQAGRDDCFTALATKYGKPQVCGEIQHTVRNKLCLAYVNDNPNMCKTPKVNYKIKKYSAAWRSDAICYKQYAINRDKPEVCGRIKGYSLLIDECNMHFALNRSEIDFCYKLTHPERIKDCLIDLKAVPLNQSGLYRWTRTCRWAGDSAYISRCYRKLAVKHKRPEICYALERVGEMETCYIQYSRTYNITTHCWKLKTTKSIVKCYGWGSHYPRYSSDCTGYPTQAVRDTCRLQAARTSKESAICGDIADENIKAECLRLMEK